VTVVYANIGQSYERGLGDGNVPSDSDREAVLYSELLAEDRPADDHTVAPSGDLYAQVQKHKTVYPRLSS